MVTVGTSFTLVVGLTLAFPLNTSSRFAACMQDSRSLGKPRFHSYIRGVVWVGTVQHNFMDLPPKSGNPTGAFRRQWHLIICS